MPIRPLNPWLGGTWSPARFVATSFLAAIATGTFLLLLPWSHSHGVSVSILEALFTSTSAVCVTGLAVLDTGSQFSRFGQVVILSLFQIGGLGLLTFGTFLTLATGGRVGYSERLRIQQQVSAFDTGGIIDLLKSIVALVAIVEISGAILLYFRFYQTEGVGEGVFYSLFHSVSAFNNAGFSLFPDSLVRFVDDPFVTLPILGLIVIGGLGFTVVADVLKTERFKFRNWSLHTKMALSATLFLIMAGTLAVLILEFTNPATLGPLDLPDKVLASLFQGITPRTAGFNTLDYSQMQTSTLLFTSLLMFIGGNPGSTAGGIKTLTLFVLAIGLWSVMRQRRDHTVFERRIASDTILRAGVVAFGAVMLVGGALTLLSISDAKFGLMPLLVETVSAFGTVGLSMGITPELSDVGRVVIIFLMYLGRIGLLTFALSFVAEHGAREIRYPAEQVVIG
ncbi:MAG: TrkH family potassium uptake protein [Acidimicrobiia bacterium]|nr:TrkH family potassium uptake protein [Acidimicrobiia bacterium]